MAPADVLKCRFLDSSLMRLARNDRGFWLICSALGDEVEEIEEFGEADGGGFGALDEGFTFGAQRGYAEGHGDAMISAGVDDGSVQLLSSRDVQSIFKFFHLGAHGAEISRDESNAIGFLDAEFLGIADADAAAGVGADGGEDGKFIDELCRECAADLGGAKALGVGGDLYGADEFGVGFLNLQHGDARAQGGEDIEERGARGVEADAVEDEAGVREERGGAEEEGGGRDVAGDGGLDGVQRLRSGDGDGVDGAGEVGAEGTESEFAVVAGADGFADRGGAFCLKAS